MKSIVLSIFLLFNFYLGAQNKTPPKLPFMRVFNDQGKKIAKGKLIGLTDSTLQLSRNQKLVSVPFTDIDIIKTKRSVGNNTLIGTCVGGGIMAILGASTADPDGWILSYSPAEGAGAGFIVGAIPGALVGSLTSIFKNSKTIEINGSQENWEAFKSLFIPQEQDN